MVIIDLRVRLFRVRWWEMSFLCKWKSVLLSSKHGLRVTCNNAGSDSSSDVNTLAQTKRGVVSFNI